MGFPICAGKKQFANVEIRFEKPVSWFSFAEAD